MLRRVGVLLAATIASLALVVTARFGWFFVFALWLALLLRAARRRPSRPLRYGAAVLAAITLFEGGMSLLSLVFGGWDAPSVRQEGGFRDDDVLRDDLLGYRPPVGQRIRSAKYAGDEEIYDVVYTTDGDGLRFSGEPPPEPVACLLFFGGSLTFGEGLTDRQAIPYRVGEQLGGRYRVHSFAFSGYGPHQMLADLERGRVRDVATGCDRVVVVALFTNGHANRSSGRSLWDTSGPRYRLQPDGSVRYEGPFDRDASMPWKLARGLLGKSFTYRQLVHDQALRPEEVALLRGIIAQSKRAADALFPGSPFLLIYLDSVDVGIEALFDRDDTERFFTGAGLRVHFLSDTIPDYATENEKYVLHPYDRHFNTRATRRIADAIAALIRDPEAP